MKKYENALKQVCLNCKTKPSNCKKDKCNRYNSLKELISETKKYHLLIEWLKEENLTKKVRNKLSDLGIIKEEPQ